MLREKCHISREGVSLLGISMGAEAIGFRTLAAEIVFENLKTDAPLPIIVHWQQKHFVVVYKFSKKDICIADPKHGLINISFDDFRKNWIGNKKDGQETGLVLFLEPTPDFYKHEGDPKNSLKLFDYFHYLRPYRKLFIQVGLGMLVSSLLSFILPFLAQSIIDIGISQSDISFITLILVFQLFFNTCNVIVDMLKGWILLYAGSRISISIISDFLVKLFKLPYSYFEQKKLGDLMQRINDHKRIQSLLTSASLYTVFNILDLIVFGIILIYYNHNIFFVFLAGNLVQLGWSFLFLRKRRTQDYKRFIQQSDNQSTIVQLLTGVQEVKLQNAERKKRWEWEKQQLKQFKISLEDQKLSQIQSTGSFFIRQTKHIFITYMSASAVIHGEITLGMMLSISYILGRLGSPFSQLSGLINSFQDAKISLERLSEVHTKDDEYGDETQKLQHLPVKKEIRFENVSFKYNEFDNALKEISCVIPEGKITAIVGLSGSGKSTMLKLLLKLYQPTKGEIKIGNTNLANISTNIWRQSCGTVTQEGFLFNDTIANNVGICDDIVSRDKLIDALDKAEAIEFVDGLPLSINTILGQDGNGLSSGQKQRLLLARVFYKNPDFVLLDEATNSLDSLNEKKIVDNLTSFFEKKTVVIVAHRLSTVKSADQIIVMKGGKIVETGDHYSLLQKRGNYYDLVKEQLTEQLLV